MAKDEQMAVRILLVGGWTDGPLWDVLRQTTTLPAAAATTGSLSVTASPDEPKAPLRIQRQSVSIPTPPMGVGWLFSPYAALLLALWLFTGFVLKNAVLGSSRVHSKLYVLFVCAAALWLSRLLVGMLVTHALHRGTLLLHQACRQYKPHLVVGFSWGGAVVWNALVRGAWKGPSLVLNPTIRAIQAVQGSGSACIPSADCAKGLPVCVIQSQNDPFCPATQLKDFELAGVHRTVVVPDDHVLFRSLMQIDREALSLLV